MFFSTAEPASGVPQVLQSQRSPISDPISADPICTGVARRGAPRAVSVSVRPRSGKFLAFTTLTIVFLIQNYRAFVRGRLAKIRISSPEFLVFGDWRRSAPQAKILRIRTPLGHLGRRARRSAPSASPKKILRFRGQFDHFGAGCGGCGGLGRGCGCEALRARWMWMCGVPRAAPAGCV